MGINLLPQAVAHLRPGVVERLRRGTQALAYFNRHGQQIWEEPRGRFAAFLPRGGDAACLVQQELGATAVAVGHRLTIESKDGGALFPDGR